MAEYREFYCPYGDDFEGGDECDRCEKYELCMETYPPVNLIEIPKGATNGDVIKAMFPNAIIEINESGSMVHVKYNDHTCWVNYELDWWNTPYKSEGE